jgi:uridine kinase
MKSTPAEPVSRPEAITWLKCQLRPLAGRTMVAIDGVDGSGKTSFADELAEELRESGTKVIRISFDNFLNPAEVRHARGLTSPEGFFEDTYDYERFIDDVLEPLSRDGSGRYRSASYDFGKEEPLNPPWSLAPDHAVVVVDGMFLHRDALRNARGKKIWDLSVWLEVPFDVSVPRMARRDGTPADPLDERNARYVKGQELYIATCEPARRADLVVDNAQDLDPPTTA